MPVQYPAHSRQTLITGLTPRLDDQLLVETEEISRFPIPELGSPHPKPDRYPNHQLAWYKPADEIGRVYQFYYLAERESQDDYNWELTKADIGGAKFDAVQRTYVTLREYFSATTPAMGAAMPNTPAGLFSGAYVLAERAQIRTNDPEIDSLFVIDKQVYIKKVPLTQLDYDEAFGGVMPMTQTLYYATETVPSALDEDDDPMTAAALFEDTGNTYWGLQSDPNGLSREGKQLSAEWYAITERYVVPPAFATDGRSYTTTIDYSWPAVLNSIRLDEWELRAGGADNHVLPDYKREAYRGPCKAVITETFHASVVTSMGEPEALLALPITISTPFLSFSDGPSLHDEIPLAITSGTNHPIYEYAGGNFDQPATDPIDWPTQLEASDEQRPFRGGYLRTQVTVYRPSYPVTP